MIETNKRKKLTMQKLIDDLFCIPIIVIISKAQSPIIASNEAINFFVLFVNLYIFYSLLETIAKHINLMTEFRADGRMQTSKKAI